MSIVDTVRDIVTWLLIACLVLLGISELIGNVMLLVPSIIASTLCFLVVLTCVIIERVREARKEKELIEKIKV